jgi:uncharacterized protein YbcC (UPF0753/DUF2309 family)
MSYTTRRSNGEIYYQGSKDAPHDMVNVRGNHGMTNDKLIYDGRNIVGKHGATRMAGEKMQKFQANLDRARESGDTEKVKDMRNTKRQRLQQARQDRASRRGRDFTATQPVEGLPSAQQPGFELRTADFQDGNRDGIDDRDQ